MGTGDSATTGTDSGTVDNSTPDSGTMDVVVGDGSSNHTVTVGPTGSLTFEPSTLTIGVGETVHWVWQSSGHTVTSGTGGTPDNKFCSPNDQNCATAATSNSGATYDHTFGAAGTYPYFCRPHAAAGMTGTITVQ